MRLAKRNIALKAKNKKINIEALVNPNACYLCRHGFILFVSRLTRNRENNYICTMEGGFQIHELDEMREIVL